MDIKEQIKDYFKSGITRKTIEELSNDITDIFTLWLDSNGYLPIQAGEDGLVKERYIEDKDIECFCGNSIKLLELYRLAKEAGLIQVQKALDESQAKQKQAEAVKKVFDWFLSRSYPEDDVIEITFSKTELDTFKQTLEEL